MKLSRYILIFTLCFLPFLVSASAEMWSIPQVVSSSSHSQSAVSAATYSGINNEGKEATHIVLVYKDKESGNLKIITSNNILEANNVQEWSWQGPRNIILKNNSNNKLRLHPADRPSAYVVDNRLYVSFVKGGDVNNTAVAHLSVGSIPGLLDAQHPWSYSYHPVIKKTGARDVALVGGLTPQVFDNVVTFQATHKMMNFPSWGNTEPMVIKYSKNNLSKPQLKGKYYLNVSNAGAAVLHHVNNGTDTHSLHTVRVIGHNLFHDYEQMTQRKYSRNKGEIIKGDNGKKIKNVLHETPALIDNNDKTMDMFFVKQNKTIQMMRYNENTEKWTGPDRVEHRAHGMGIAPIETKEGVSVLNIDGVQHLFYVDKTTDKLQHIYK